MIGGGFEDDAALADLRVAVGREAGEAAELAEVGRAGDGEGDDGDLGVAGLGELGGLGDIFRDDEFAGDLGGEIEAGEGLFAGESVGGVEAVGDGDLLDVGTGEGVEGEGLGGGVFAGPEDENAVGVGDGNLAAGEIGGDELFGVDVVCGEEEVLGVAVGDLLGKGGGGAEGGDDFDAGGHLVLGCEGGEDGLEVGGGGDVEFSGCLRVRGGGQRGEE